MTALPLLRQNLASKRTVLNQAEKRPIIAPPALGEWMRNYLGDGEFVLFCGAGISIAPPSSAPSFLELRNAVVLALGDLLMDRGLLTEAHLATVETALHQLESRRDLTLPPEEVFSQFRNAIGFDQVSRMLICALDRGRPNANHLAIRVMIRPTGPRLAAIVTPNFDLYIEKELEGISTRVTIGQDAPVGDGFTLFKPHGSLDRPESIAITVDRISQPLRGAARRAFYEVVAGRTVVVTGYSGWDYDLLPLLIHAGREWNTKILWILHNADSFNERTAIVQLALGDRVTTLNAQERSVLPLLACVDRSAPAGEPERLRGPFANILSDSSSDGLAASLVSLITPSGVPETSDVVPQLCKVLLDMAESGLVKDDSVLLGRMGLVVAFAKDERRRRAAQLALECARRLGNELSIRAFERTAKGEDTEFESPAARLDRIEDDLRTFPFAFKHDPNPEMAKRWVRTGLRIDRASALMDVRRWSDAESLAREVLEDTRFPESGVCEDAYMVSDGSAAWKLHFILGELALRSRKTDEGQRELCCALDVLWREVEFWDLGTALHRVALAVLHRDKECAEAALDLGIRLATYCRDAMSQLAALERKASYGLGTAAELERANTLLLSLNLPDEDRQKHVHLLDSYRGRMSKIRTNTV